MPDAAGLELMAAALRESLGEDVVVATEYHRGQACLSVDPGKILPVLRLLRDDPSYAYTFLSSLHGCDYLPSEPRLGVHYELLNMERAERLRVKARLPIEAPVLDSCVELFPTADFQEREVYDMFGVVFRGHPDPRRILLPEDYEGHPQRRDFPLGGEPVIFTRDEADSPGWYR